jgi:hypothetical protein
LEFACFVGLIAQETVQKYIEENILNLHVFKHLKKLGFRHAREHKYE